MKDLIKNAYDFATKKHQGQFRKNNKEPYINHPIRVSKIVKKFKKSKKLMN